MFTQLTDTLITMITNFYIETGLIGIFLIMTCENCYIPLPASEVVIPIAGVLITRRYLLSDMPEWASITLVSLSSTLGCLTGSIAAYIIGSIGGRSFLLKYGRYILLSQRDIERADLFFLRWGSATVFYSRLLPVVRTWASLPAGATRMSLRKFCLYTFIGSLLWCTVLTYLGTILGNNINQLKPISGYLSTCILIICAVLVVLYIWKRIHAIHYDRETKTTR
ncbi:alkaline phosphatase [Ktedonobacteria bacterium brp13]|nr:alkaline phosphatase [Ktedonobacteria bacterium brp13]